MPYHGMGKIYFFDVFDGEASQLPVTFSNNSIAPSQSFLFSNLDIPYEQSLIEKELIH